MKILFVHPAAKMAIGDVARGYRAALERQGHDVRDYSLINRFAYHQRALPPDVAANPANLSRQASENVVNEALYHEAELVIIVSGLNLHPIALWLLGKVNIRAVVIFTESPYDDHEQAQWASLTHVGGDVDLTIFTNDRYSAMSRGWHLLSPAYDPELHCPVAPSPEDLCDVVLVGTGWEERQRFLEAVDWKGIDFRLYGVWPNITTASPIHQYLRPVVDNAEIAAKYCSARICINLNRESKVALTPGPRTYELAACGAFQISDPRKDMVSLFGPSVPTFDTPDTLGRMMRYYLEHPDDRARKANEARERVQNQTFDHRATSLIGTITTRMQVKKGA